MSRPKYQRHDARKYDLRRSTRWIDHRGERYGRLLCLEWIGRWHGHGYWRCQCDCGRQAIVTWHNRTLSCGCANGAANKVRDFTTLREDGTWRHNLAKRITLPDGRVFQSIEALARHVGCVRDTMCKRLRNWPPERWTEPPHPRGMGEKKHRRRWMNAKARERKTRKPQPWSAANLGDHARKEHEREGPA